MVTKISDESPAGEPAEAPAARKRSIVTLEPQMRSDASLKRIHRALFERILANEDGVRKSLEGEFLHDFRVATRRTRTGLRQLRKVYPKETARHFEAEFAWVAETTNAARDLEVYLEALKLYGEALGAEDRDALAPFAEFLGEHQRAERRRCAETVDSERYRDLKDRWAAFLDADEPPDAAPAKASAPVSEVAAGRIRKAHERVVRCGREVAPESEARRFHRLRLQCKKLRYLLEFFHSLFDESAAESAITTLKNLQDVLGDFNDLEIQLRWVDLFRASQALSGSRPTGQYSAVAVGAPPADPTGRTAAAVEHLVVHLATRRDHQRSRFFDEFANFMSPASQNHYRWLTETRNAKPRARQD